MKRFLAALVVFTATACWAAGGDEPEQRYQELFRSESVYPQEAGEFQLTLSAARGIPQEPGVAVLSPEVEYGITDRLQLTAGWENVHSRWDALGPSHMSIGVQRSFVDLAGEGLHASTGAEFSAEELGLFGAWAKDFSGAGAQIFGSVTGELAQAGGDDDGNGTNRLLVTGGATASRGAVRWVAEWSLTRFADPSVMEFTPGLLVRAFGKYEVGFGVPVRLWSSGTPADMGRAGVMAFIVREWSLR